MIICILLPLTGFVAGYLYDKKESERNKTERAERLQGELDREHLERFGWTKETARSND